MLEPIGDQIWTCPVDFKVGGFLALNGRMTVIRLPDGGLWLHSPVQISDALRAEVDALGPVQHIVAPSGLHHLFAPAWMSAYPDAVLYGVRGLEKKHPEQSFVFLGEENGAVSWEGIEQCALAGMPAVNEVLFFHQPSQTLIVTDFLFYMPDTTGFIGAYAWLNGFKQRVITPPIFRLGIRDKAAFRHSLVPLRKWSPSAISMCHHTVYVDGATAALHDALDRLQVPSA